MGIESTIKKNKKVIEVKRNGFYYEYNGDKYFDLNDLKEEIDITDEASYEICIITEGSCKEFSFETCTLPNCCGVLELGSFSMDKGMPEKELVKILDVIAIKKNKTTIITTNGKDHSIIMEKALAISSYFTLVKSFKNSGVNGSLIKVWLSNNE